MNESHKIRVRKAIETFNSLTHYPRDPVQEIKDIEEIEEGIKKSLVEKIPDITFPFSPLERLIEEKVRVVEAISRSRLMAPPWTVTGRANYKGNPEKARRVEERAFNNLKRIEKMFDRQVNLLKKANEGTKVEVYDAELKQLEEKQVLMKAVNKIIRSTGGNREKAFTEIVEKKLLSEEEAREVCKPNFLGDIGYARFELTNNNANIKRVRDRLAVCQKEEAKQTKEVTVEGDIRIVDNREADRIQVFYPGKPSSDTIKNLKQNAFKWSPSNGAWQRMRTDGTRRVIKQIYGVEL